MSFDSSKKTTESEFSIIIYLKQGKDLCVRDISSKKQTFSTNILHLDSSDPYVVFKAGKMSVKSKVAKQNLNPIWNDHIELFLSQEFLQEDGILEIEVWDKDFLKSDDYMGRTLVILDEIEKWKNFSLPLEDVESGIIEFEIETYNFEKLDKTKIVKKKYFNDEDVRKIIERKFIKSKYKREFDRETLEKIVNAFSDVELFKETYLNKDWIESFKIHKKLISTESFGTLIEDTIDDEEFGELTIENIEKEEE